MITQILNIIIGLLHFIISYVLNLILSVFPNFGLAQLTSAWLAFFGLLGTGINLLYFMSGGMLFIYADIIGALFIIKHIALPIVNFIRKVVIK